MKNYTNPLNESISSISKLTQILHHGYHETEEFLINYTSKIKLETIELWNRLENNLNHHKDHFTNEKE